MSDYVTHPYDAEDEEIRKAFAAKDAEIAHLRAENAILKSNLAEVNNYHRHRFDEAIEKATDELFKTLSYHRMIAPKDQSS